MEMSEGFTRKIEDVREADFRLANRTQAYELYLQQRQFARGVPDRNDAGIEVLQKAIAIDPNFALAYAELAYRHLFKGNVYGRVEYMRAVEAARNAVRIDPNLARGHHSLGSALNHIGRVDEARLSFQRAIELDASYPDAMYDLALMELNSGRLDQSAYWSMRGWPLAPNLSYSYYHVGLTLVMLDEVVAERWLAAAVARFGTDSATSTRLVMLRAVLAFRRGDAPAGLALARDAARLSPNYAGSRSVLAEAATHAGAADAAVLVDALLKESFSGRGWWSASAADAAGVSPRAAPGSPSGRASCWRQCSTSTARRSRTAITATNLGRRTSPLMPCSAIAKPHWPPSNGPSPSATTRPKSMSMTRSSRRSRRIPGSLPD
jgi:Tetratricopeptide repeat